MASGGNVKKAKAAAKVEIMKKSALVAIDVANAPTNPKPFKAEDIDSAVEQLGVSFKVKLQKLDGTTIKEKIAINALNDFEEAELVQQSEALNEQRRQMIFLHDFQEELNNKNFREELKELLESDKKEKLLTFLKGWSKQLKKPESRFLNLLRSGI